MLTVTGLAIGMVVFEAGTVLMSTALCAEHRHKPKGVRHRHSGAAANDAGGVAVMQAASAAAAANAAAATSAAAAATPPPPPPPTF